MSDFTIGQLEALKEGTTPGPWEAKDDHGGPNLFSPTGRLLRSDSCGDVSGEEDDVGLMAAAPALVDALIAEKHAHQALRDELAYWKKSGEYIELAPENRLGVGASKTHVIISDNKARTTIKITHDLASDLITALLMVKSSLEGE